MAGTSGTVGTTADTAGSSSEEVSIGARVTVRKLLLLKQRSTHCTGLPV